MVSTLSFIFFPFTRRNAKIACSDQGESQVLREDKTQVVEEPIHAQLVRDPVPENTVVAEAVPVEGQSQDAVAEPVPIADHIDDHDNTNEPVAIASVVVQAVHNTTHQMGGTNDRRSFRRAKRALYFLKICKYMSVGALCGILIAMGLVSCGTLPFLIMGSGACVYMWVIAQKTSEDIQRFVV